MKVNNKQDAIEVEHKFPALAEKYKTDEALRDKTWGVQLVPLSDIHLNAYKPYEREAKGSRKTVNFITLIAFVILVVGWINFINTHVSKSIERAGEVGVRKMAGASMRDLWVQFIVESILLNLLAMVFFFVFVLLFRPLFENLQAETVPYPFWQRPLVWRLIGISFFVGCCITTVIPVLVLKRVNIAAVLKNNLSFRGGMGRVPRLTLIVFQYFAAMVLIIATFTVSRQLNYMRSMELGIGIDQTLVFKTPAKTADYDSKLQALVQAVKGFSGVTSVTSSSSIPGRLDAFVMSNQRDNDPLKENRLCDMLRVDPDFIPGYQLQLTKGRNFSKDRPADKEDAVVLTQNALELFGFKTAEEALNGAINLEGQGNKKFPVIGVVKDFRQLSPRESFRPIILVMFSPWASLDINFVSIKLEPTASRNIVQATEQQFKATFPDSSFDSFFLDEYFNRQYVDDTKYGTIIKVFSWLALIIVCLGIFGVSSFMLIKRNREIAIRKVIGAGSLQIVKLLNLDFIRCIGIAFLLAMPTAWWAMHSWLRNFSSQASLSIWMFLLAGLTTLVITFTVVSSLAFKTIVSNPTKSLRAE